MSVPVKPFERINGPLNGPGYSYESCDGYMIDRFRFDPGHPGYPDPHINFEQFVQSGGRFDRIVNRHIPHK